MAIYIPYRGRVIAVTPPTSPPRTRSARVMHALRGAGPHLVPSHARHMESIADAWMVGELAGGLVRQTDTCRYDRK